MTDQERVEFSIQAYTQQAKRDVFFFMIGGWTGSIAMWLGCGMLT